MKYLLNLYCTLGIGLLLIVLHVHANDHEKITNHMSPSGINDHDSYLNLRVDCQKQIENFYWANRNWPIGNNKTKPDRLAVISDSQILAKVINNLQMEIALKTDYQVSITPEMIQAEIKRMVNQTQSPKQLKSLFDTFDNNPNLVAECLARPNLIRQKLFQYYSWNQEIHQAIRNNIEDQITAFIRTGDANLLKGSYSSVRYKKQESIAEESISETETQLISEEEFNRYRYEQSKKINLTEKHRHFEYKILKNQSDDLLTMDIYSWTKNSFYKWWSEMSSTYEIDQIKKNSHQYYLPQASRIYEDDSWVVPDFPLGRANHTAIWTGSEMIVWGGANQTSTTSQWTHVFDYAFKYDLITDSWESIRSINPAPKGRTGHSAVWTGTEMVIIGGRDDRGHNRSKSLIFNPATNKWRSHDDIAELIQPDLFWTGENILIWGLDFFGEFVGKVYDPFTGAVNSISSNNQPSKRIGYSSIWTGNELIVWGGQAPNGQISNDGKKYNPKLDIWSDVSQVNKPSARLGHIGLWLDDKMFIWGGGTTSTLGGLYSPETDSWEIIDLDPLTSNQVGYSKAIWTGSEVIFIGNEFSRGELKGYKYSLSQNLVTPLTNINQPSNLINFTLNWTGTELVIWGGHDENYSITETGGRYNPVTDLWNHLPTSGPKLYGYSVWTGNELVFWNNDNGGSKFEPLTGLWFPISTTNAPNHVQEDYSMTWSGEEIFLLGGVDDNELPLNEFYSYVVAQDTWKNIGLPQGLSDIGGHSSQWVNSEIFIYNRADITNMSRFNPKTEEWNDIPMGEIPNPRIGFSVTSTGQEIIIWGGYKIDDNNFPVYYNDGYTFDFQSNSWAQMRYQADIYPRAFHSAVWTGDELLIWGGINFGGSTYIGRQGIVYNLQTDSWRFMNDHSISGRTSAGSVWTGSEMIIWGGNDDYDYKSGGIYNYDNDSWRSMSLLNATVGFSGSNVFWNHDHMVVSSGRYTSIYIPRGELIFKNSFE